MENKKATSFVFWIIAIILGVTLYKDFDFQNFKFEKPALAVVYIIVFVGCVFLIIKNFRKNNSNQQP
jgi:predicted ferric reductase